MRTPGWETSKGILMTRTWVTGTAHSSAWIKRLLFLVAEAVVRHGGRSGIRLGIFGPRKNPLPRSFFGDVLQQRRLVYRSDQCTVRLGDGVAVSATVARQQPSPQIKLRRALKGVHVTLAARRLEITCRQYRLLPCLGAVVRLLDGCGSSLPVMANDTAKLRERVRHRRMLTEGLLAHITEACFLQGYMAGCAAIDHALLGRSEE